MGEYAETVVRGGRVSLWMAEQMLKEVKAETFARKPNFGGTVIDTNHPAFVYGHLSTYPSKWLSFLGLDGAVAAVPGTYDELFLAGKPCHDDPAGTIYPPMQEITERFFTVHKAAVDLIAKVDDAKLHAPNPREGRMKEMFPTTGGMVIFYMTSHMMLHLGQVSAWRRCFGLGSAM